MRLFALQTDTDKMIRGFASGDEREILNVPFDGFVFFTCLAGKILMAGVIAAAVILLNMYTSIPPVWTTSIGVAIWLIAAPAGLIKTYVDWKYDFVSVTNHKVIVVDQSMLFSQKIQQISLENIAQVSSQNSYWNLLGFGTVRLHLKEGFGKEVVLDFVNDAAKVADVIADTVTAFQREHRSHASVAA